ncbi:MAG: LysM peptidoglycan-binding domain-containing protein [Planctomycetota bacterium]
MSAAYKIALAAGGLLLLVVVASLMFNNPENPSGTDPTPDPLASIEAADETAPDPGESSSSLLPDPPEFGVDLEPLGPPVRDTTDDSATTEDAPPTRVAYADEPALELPVEREPEPSLTVGRSAFPDDPFARSPFAASDEPITPPDPLPLDALESEDTAALIDPAEPTPAAANTGIALGPLDPVTRNDAEAAVDAGPLPPPEPPVLRLYTVESGDSLSSIALATYGSANKWVDIAQANPLVDPNRLRVGQELKLPNLDAPRASARSDGSNNSETGDDLPRRGATYVVKSGDNLSNIAKQFYNSSAKWELIYQANRQKIGDNPGNLQLGMELLIPPPDNGAN